MDAFFTSSGLLALITLTILIFIAILSSKLPGSQQGRARRIGLLAAMGMRILLLLSIFWIIVACSCSRRRGSKFTSVWKAKKATARIECSRRLQLS
jgi:predicted tellurium resistance membrane protein TerC